MVTNHSTITGPNAEAVKRKTENAKKIAAITRRLKQGTAREERPHFGMEYAAKSILNKFDAGMYAALFTRPHSSVWLDFDHMSL